MRRRSERESRPVAQCGPRLAGLAKSYETLAARLDEVSTLGGRTTEQRALLEQEATNLHRRLFDLAWQAAEIEARSVADLTIKAWILREWCEVEPTDLVSRLTLAVCNDIVALGTRGGARPR